MNNTTTKPFDLTEPELKAVREAVKAAMKLTKNKNPKKYVDLLTASAVLRWNFPQSK